MIPGFRGASPKQLRKMMKRMGIVVEELKDVDQVVIKTREENYVFEEPTVTKMVAQGQETYQIVGKAKISKEVEEIPEEDVELVAEQANVSKEEARKALEECKGNPAEAILKLTQ